LRLCRFYYTINPAPNRSGSICLSFFVEHRHPRELISYLTGERNYGVKETSPGISTVSGDYLPIQIIETKRLSAEENLWLKSLTNDLESGAASSILKAGKDAAPEASLSAYLDVLLRANAETFLEAWNMVFPPKTGGAF
jgi:hypothetical protein